ncbi:hypothetical protein AVKW3434_18270 [Acidovorax sp. SUPP3434]|uniref:DUF7684 family protein n=1 Tax=Acidovorax sp. SUPP3434 TaxID=2920880 RepID=UPI0023DE5AE6|nr:hypothetical protein [Acidovorax sp. SUPP3434]GKT01365.1 hypothetical protein AVKW3434_18270 [Acidovorax sp. SUPP3434]
MNSSNIYFKDICQPLSFSDMAGKFAALLDAGDLEWQDVFWLKQTVRDFLNAGCNYFVCYGESSEIIHDLIDEVVEGCGFLDISTTYHNDESKSDVASFFKLVAMQDMSQGLIFVHNLKDWRSVVN